MMRARFLTTTLVFVVSGLATGGSAQDDPAKALKDALESIIRGKIPEDGSPQVQIFGMQSARDLEDCNQLKEPDKTIRGCTALLSTPGVMSPGGNAPLYLKRGTAFQAKRQHDLALADMNEAIRLDPNFTPAYTVRASVYWRLGRLDEAKADADKALQMPAKNVPRNILEPATSAIRGHILLTLGQVDAAMADFDKAVSLNSPFFYWGRGQAYERQDRLVEALADYQRAVKVVAEFADDREAQALARERITALEPEVARLEEDRKKATQGGQGVAGPPAFGKRVALVIGNTKYQGSLSSLATPANDARAVAALFRNLGFGDENIVERHDLNRQELVRALKEFEAKARDADWAIVFFAGHGVRARNNQDFLIPIDADIQAEADLPDEAVALERVVDRVYHAKQMQLIIFDACRDNPLTRRLYATAARGGTASAAPFQAPGLIMAFSARRGQTASDGRMHSPFAEALLRYREKPRVPMDEMFAGIVAEVQQATGDLQTPEIFGLHYAKGVRLFEKRPLGRQLEATR